MPKPRYLNLVKRLYAVVEGSWQFGGQIISGTSMGCSIADSSSCPDVLVHFSSCGFSCQLEVWVVARTRPGSSPETDPAHRLNGTSTRCECVGEWTLAIAASSSGRARRSLGKRGSIQRGARSLVSGGLRRWFSCKYLDICCKNRLASHPDPSAAHPRE